MPRSNPDAARARPGVEQGEAADTIYASGRITVPTMLIGDEWYRDTPAAMRQALFPLLMNAPGKRYGELERSRHMTSLKRERHALFGAVHVFFDEAVADAPRPPVQAP